MENEIFIDISGFYATLIEVDNRHEEAKKIFQNAAKKRQKFVTTDYILDETITLLRARGHSNLADNLIQRVFDTDVCRIEWIDSERFYQVWQFANRTDEDMWSFTDCFSFWIMGKLDLSRALTKDKHFEHAGFIPLLR